VCSAWRKKGERMKKEGGEKEKEKREKRGGIRGGDRGVGRAREAVGRYAVRHAERGKGAAIDFSVGRRKRREGFRGIGISDGRRI